MVVCPKRIALKFRVVCCREELHFIQGWAPTCFALSVRVWLDKHFVVMWIGRRGPAETLPLSPGLTPCDWFLWGCAKEEVYLWKPKMEKEIRGTWSRFPLAFWWSCVLQVADV